jgi:GH24 family phage-related lysozyme (muramidase)
MLELKRQITFMWCSGRVNTIVEISQQHYSGTARRPYSARVGTWTLEDGLVFAQGVKETFQQSERAQIAQAALTFATAKTMISPLDEAADAAGMFDAPRTDDAS